MTAPSPRDTRLFDAGARWATEPTDRRGYGDALRAAVARATLPGDRDRGRELARVADQVQYGLGMFAHDDPREGERAIRQAMTDLRCLAAPAETEAEDLSAWDWASATFADADGWYVTGAAPDEQDPSIVLHVEKGGRAAAERVQAALLAASSPAPEGEAVGVALPVWRLPGGKLAARLDSIDVWLDADDGPGQGAVRLAATTPTPAGPRAEGAVKTEAMSVLQELVEGEDHWTPERDEAYQAAKHRARALMAEGDPYGVDPYGTGDGSYPEPSVDAADEAGPDVTGYIGAVRRGPQGHGVVRIDNAGADDWLMLGGARTAAGEPLGGRYADRSVEHWPVAGVVPGTPAAWMSGEPIPDRDDESGEW